MKIEIKFRFTPDILFSIEADSIKIALESAVSVQTNLRGAGLRNADLRGANLRGANLRGADLDGAGLRNADLRGANLRGANLRGANLDDADLDDADLDGADLRGAGLRGEKLKKTPLVVLNLQWDVLITDSYMTIGCQRHTHSSWNNFDESSIRKMHPDAFDFWKTWRSALLSLCEGHSK